MKVGIDNNDLHRVLEVIFVTKFCWQDRSFLGFRSLKFPFTIAVFWDLDRHKEPMEIARFL